MSHGDFQLLTETNLASLANRLGSADAMSTCSSGASGESRESPFHANDIYLQSCRCSRSQCLARALAAVAQEIRAGGAGRCLERRLRHARRQARRPRQGHLRQRHLHADAGGCRSFPRRRTSPLRCPSSGRFSLAGGNPMASDSQQDNARGLALHFNLRRRRHHRSRHDLRAHVRRQDARGVPGAAARRGAGS